MSGRGCGDGGNGDGIRPPFAVTLFILFGLLILVGMGQWDWVLAGLIGVILGVSLLGLFGR